MKFIVDENYFARADAITQAVQQENGLVLYFSDTSTKLIKNIDSNAIQNLLQWLAIDEKETFIFGGAYFDFRKYR